MKRAELLPRLALGLAVAIFAVGLAGYMLAGSTARFMKDDYCYASVLDHRDLLDGQIHSYLSVVVYSGNRFALNLGMALSEFAGRWTVSALPAMMIALWVAGLFVLIRQLALRVGRVLGPLPAALGALALALYTLAMAPNWVQILYWRPGMFPYFAPIVLGCWLAVTMLAYTPGRWAPAQLIGVFLLAWLVGGFSEVANAVEVTALGLATGGAVLLKARRAGLPVSLAALAGALLALALLALSPVTAHRLNSLYGGHAGLLPALLEALRGAVAFYVGVAYRSTLLYASAFVFFVGCALILAAPWEQAEEMNPRVFLGRASLLVVMAMLLTWAAMMPSFYAASGAPGQRELVVPTFVSIVLIAGLGLLSGDFLAGWLGRRPNNRWVPAGLVLLVVMIGMLWSAALQESFGIPTYPDMRVYVQANWLASAVGLVFGLLVALGAARWLDRRWLPSVIVALCLVQPGLISAQIYAQVPALQVRAALWDQREAQIQAFRAQGETRITVHALDSLAGIAELTAKNNDWINVCAARYYGIESIKAVEPVMRPAQP